MAKNPNWGGARPNAGRKPLTGTALTTALKETANPAQTELALENRAVQDHRIQQGLINLISASRASKARKSKKVHKQFCPFKLPSFPPGVEPSDPALSMAMDEAPAVNWAANQWIATSPYGLAQEGLLFLGYPYLSDLMQRPEYRTFGETLATEMTRKWIEFKGSTDNGDDGKGNTKSDSEVESKIKELQEFMDHLRVRDRFSDLSLVDSGFGRAHLHMDFGDMRDEELATPIGNGRDEWTKAKVTKGSLKGLRVIEPVWTYPTTYNAAQPLAPDWYDPQVWYVMGRQIHKTRLIPYVTRPVPDLLKPSYAFGGLALSQIAKPYVDIWLTTRQSVADLIHSFAVMVLMTDMAQVMQPGGAANLMLRLELFSELRDNNGVFALNKTTEDFKNVVTPLGGLHELQAQSQEHMMSVARIPAVKFTGMQPQGLNASSDGEIRTFYDTINAGQNRHFRAPLTTVIDVAQISLWGARDPRITWDFVPLWELSEKEKGEMRKANAETDGIYVDKGIVSPEEVRAKVAADPESGYHGLDPDDVPDLAQEEEQGLEPEGGKKPGCEGAEGGGTDA